MVSKISDSLERKFVPVLLSAQIVVRANRKLKASISYLQASSDVMHVPPATNPKAIFVALLAVLLMSGEWILLVAGTHKDEMIVGAASVLVSGAFLFVAHRTSTLHTDFRLSDIAKGWRIPWYVASGIYEITVILLKDIFGIERTKSLYRVSGFKTAKYDAVLVTRRVLAIVYTTTAPNFIVIGIDYTQSRMLFHQLERSSVPRMTKELGAQL